MKYSQLTYSLVGKNPLSDEAENISIEEEIAQAFQNVNIVIISTLEKSNHTKFNESQRFGSSGWDFVFKVRSYHVGMSKIDTTLRDLMTKELQKWCPSHQPLFTMIGVECLPFANLKVELEVEVYLG